eukprot:GHVU01204731.1.p2 GENE.GHVU01204731.1~~GHVU01204731.1.p2  ORF type:complete len:119 (+),score=5.17 GHVU01204731.1:407-763(+)
MITRDSSVSDSNAPLNASAATIWGPPIQPHERDPSAGAVPPDDDDVVHLHTCSPAPILASSPPPRIFFMHTHVHVHASRPAPACTRIFISMRRQEEIDPPCGFLLFIIAIYYRYYLYM